MSQETLIPVAGGGADTGLSEINSGASSVSISMSREPGVSFSGLDNFDLRSDRCETSATPTTRARNRKPINFTFVTKRYVDRLSHKTTFQKDDCVFRTEFKYSIHNHVFFRTSFCPFSDAQLKYCGDDMRS